MYGVGRSTHWTMTRRTASRSLSARGRNIKINMTIQRIICFTQYNGLFTLSDTDSDPNPVTDVCPKIGYSND